MITSKGKNFQNKRTNKQTWVVVDDDDKHTHDTHSMYRDSWSIEETSGVGVWAGQGWLKKMEQKIDPEHEAFFAKRENDLASESAAKTSASCSGWILILMKTWSGKIPMASCIDGVIKPIVAEGRTGFCDKYFVDGEKETRKKRIFLLNIFLK